MIRDLARKVYQFQNPSKDAKVIAAEIHEFQSLENLILKNPWKGDYPMKLGLAVLTYGHIEDDTINKAKEKMEWFSNFKFNKIGHFQLTMEKVLELDIPINEDPIIREQKVKLVLESTSISQPFYLNFRIIFHFLTRRYKHIRNALIHGNYNEHNQEFDLFYCLSALIKISGQYKKYTSIIDENYH